MKFLLIILLAAFCLSRVHCQDEEYQEEQSPYVGNHPQPDVCVPICFAEKPDPELEMFFGNLGHPIQIKYIHKILVPRILNKYCEHVNETWSCLEHCQPSQMKTIFSQAFLPLSYMCIES
uniref:Uncharacterized protein n=1 Tax=Romanomermis culicivorax TaxID=13658 RepID=A0A915HP76_ROMCU